MRGVGGRERTKKERRKRERERDGERGSQEGKALPDKQIRQL